MNSNLPLVSIITPCYNYGRYLAETLKSLINQKYQNWECIIVNDGSTDNTEEVATQFSKIDARFIYISQNNTGLPGARNTALKCSRGKYIQFLDADDFIENEKLSLQVELLEQNSYMDFVYGNMLIFANNAKDRVFNSFKLINHHEISGKNEAVIDAFVEDTFFLPGCVIFRRSLYEKVGLFNEDLYGLEDWEYWSRAALLGFEFYWDKRIGTRLIVRDHDSNMSKVREKMLLSRLVARRSIVNTAINLRNNQVINLDKTYLDNLIKHHQILTNKEMYDYNIHFGNKIIALKELIKYSIKSGQLLYPVKRFIKSLQYKIRYKL